MSEGPRFSSGQWWESPFSDTQERHYQSKVDNIGLDNLAQYKAAWCVHATFFSHFQEGEKMLQEGHWAPDAIRSRLLEIDELWDELLQNCHEKKRKLQDASKVNPNPNVKAYYASHSALISPWPQTSMRRTLRTQSSDFRWLVRHRLNLWPAAYVAVWITAIIERNAGKQVNWALNLSLLFEYVVRISGRTRTPRKALWFAVLQTALANGKLPSAFVKPLGKRNPCHNF